MCVILFCFSNQYSAVILFMATTSMSNDTVIKSNDYTFIIHYFDNILRFSHSTFSYKDDPDLLHQTALTSTLPIAADSCFGGAFMFRRSIHVSEEHLHFGGGVLSGRRICVFEELEESLGKTVCVSKES